MMTTTFYGSGQQNLHGKRLLTFLTCQRWEPQARQDLKAHKEKEAILDLKVTKAIRVRREIRDLRAQADRWEVLGQQGHKVCPDHRASPDSQASEEKKGLRVTLA